ncbi:hypothetical protein AWM79_06250 [Pseudomonas agarici]|uniref:Uncharacterized protein n=2 Tax=Pseudomonas agarici TaxID=46677 RepID=A0A0X1SYM5_PSEAA|nr:hypothetical protein AWM79_06250 [Pseudomonas agarici]SEK67476.1 Tir chaperone protein (CesT) family protein [Pseudomonas agarici]
MQPTFTDVLKPLFKYLGMAPSVSGHEEAFELMLRSQRSIELHNYPLGTLTLSSSLPFEVAPKDAGKVLLELLQANVMNPLSPPVVIAANSVGDQIVLWARVAWEGLTPDQLISLYERFAHYTETVNKRLAVSA